MRRIARSVRPVRLIEIVVGRPDQQPLPLLLAPAGDELGQDRALGRPADSRALPASRAAADSSFRVTVRPASSASFLAARAACLSRRPPDDASCIVPSMLRAKRERSPKPMLLTLSLSGWHKDVANTSLMPPLGGISKGPRSFQLRGPFALPGLRHDISLLSDEDGFEGMGDGVLTRLEATALDGLVDRSRR